MGRDGTLTRKKILVESKRLVLSNGFAGTSIDQILERTGITKGAFFYHFKTKNALAKALIEEYAREDRAEMDKILDETDLLKGDSLNRLLEFVQQYIDLMSDLKSDFPGCLYASFVYEPNHFNADIKDIISESILLWRNTFITLLEDVLKEYDSKNKVDIISLADHFTVIFEGAFIVSRSLNDKKIIEDQLQHLKNYFQLLFSPK